MGDPATIALYLTFFGTLGVAFLMFLGLFLLVVITLVIAGVGRLFALTLMVLVGRRPRNETLPLVRLYGTAAAPSEAAAGDSGDEAAAPPPPRKPARAGVLRAKSTAWRNNTGTAVSSRLPAAGGKGKAAVAPLPAPRDWRKAVRNARNLLKPSELRPRLHDEVEHHPLLAAARRHPLVLAEDWAAAVAEADARAMARARSAAPEIKTSVRDLPDPDVPAEKVAAVAPLVQSALHQDRPSQDVPRSFKKPPAAGPLSALDTGSLLSLSGHAKILKGKLPADRR